MLLGVYNHLDWDAVLLPSGRPCSNVLKKRISTVLGAGLLLGLLALCVAMFTVVPNRVTAGLNRVTPDAPAAISESIAARHRKLFVADLHADATLWNRDISLRSEVGHVDIPRLIEGNVALQGFSVATRIPASLNIESNADRWDVVMPLAVFQGWPANTWNSPLQRALYQARLVEKAAERSAGSFTLIRTRQDFERYLVRREANPAITAGFLTIEGLHCLEGEIENVRVLFNAGFRLMAPTHFFDNALGGSAHGLDKFGITEFGERVIRFMEGLKILVDLAHASPRLLDDTLARVQRPVLISHTGVRGTCDNQRNLSDEQLRRIAAGGGLIGIGFWDTATCGNDTTSIARAIKHTVQTVGAEHTALGSDFDGATTTPFDAADLALLTDALVREGLTDDEIALVMGENVRRLLLAQLPSDADNASLIVP